METVHRSPQSVSLGPAGAAFAAALRAFAWMAAGVGAGILALVAFEGVSTDGRPLPWEALGGFLLAAGAAGVVAAPFAAEAWRPRLFCLGAGMLVTPGLLLGAPPPWMAVPGLAVPALALTLRRQAAVQVAALALLGLAFLGLQSAVPWLGGERGLLYLLGGAAAALTLAALPADRAWRPSFGVAAAVPLVLVAM